MLECPSTIAGRLDSLSYVSTSLTHMDEKPDKIREARDLLEREREEVVAALALARAHAQEIAEQQKAWRTKAAELLERGDAAGLSVPRWRKLSD
jgi:predicted  nucleic acid-binding Zn-ribbon protein